MGNKTMNFLVLGCNGMAGHLISLYLKEQGHRVLGFARSKSPYVDSVTGDAEDKEAVKEIVTKGGFDSVINCIGVLNQAAENDHARAVYLNAWLPHYLAEITSGTNTQIIQMSTDCIFSGNTGGGYTEHGLRDGESFYDRSKALGELEDEKNITLRNSIVGPDIKASGIGLLNWFLQQKGEVKGYTRAIWTGQTTLQLAKTMEAAAKQRAHGLYNMVPKQAISKYDLLCLFNREIRRECIRIVPQEDFVSDKSLVRTNYEGFAWEIPDYETMVKELGQWMRAHRALYPHYEL